LPSGVSVVVVVGATGGSSDDAAELTPTLVNTTIDATSKNVIVATEVDRRLDMAMNPPTKGSTIGFGAFQKRSGAHLEDSSAHHVVTSCCPFTGGRSTGDNDIHSSSTFGRHPVRMLRAAGGRPDDKEVR
jgi:hypothetical protein